MNDKQRKTVELLYKLGSDPAVTKETKGIVRVGLPFRVDRNPNIEVFKDGYYYDYSNSDGWEDRGLHHTGNSQDLERYFEEEMIEIYNSYKNSYGEIDDEDIRIYAKRRKLYDFSYGEEDGRKFLAFPMFDPDNNGKGIVGIQRRYIDDKEPKNKMVKNSSGYSIFKPISLSDTGVLLVTEGATDSHSAISNGLDVVGAPSCSMVQGVISYIMADTRCDTIVLAFDDDEAGHEASNKVYEAIKKKYPNHVFILDHAGYKDVNEMVVNDAPFNWYLPEETKEMISFITYNGKQILDSGIAIGIPKQFVPKMLTYQSFFDYEDGEGKIYLAESLGLQMCYDFGGRQSNPIVIVRGL